MPSTEAFGPGFAFPLDQEVVTAIRGTAALTFCQREWQRHLPQPLCRGLSFAGSTVATKPAQRAVARELARAYGTSFVELDSAALEFVLAEATAALSQPQQKSAAQHQKAQQSQPSLKDRSSTGLPTKAELVAQLFVTLRASGPAVVFLSDPKLLTDAAVSAALATEMRNQHRHQPKDHHQQQQQQQPTTGKASDAPTTSPAPLLFVASSDIKVHGTAGVSAVSTDGAAPPKGGRGRGPRLVFHFGSGSAASSSSSGRPLSSPMASLTERQYAGKLQAIVDSDPELSRLSATSMPEFFAAFNAHPKVNALLRDMAASMSGSGGDGGDEEAKDDEAQSIFGNEDEEEEEEAEEENHDDGDDEMLDAEDAALVDGLLTALGLGGAGHRHKPFSPSPLSRSKQAAGPTAGAKHKHKQRSASALAPLLSHFETVVIGAPTGDAVASKQFEAELRRVKQARWLESNTQLLLGQLAANRLACPGLDEPATCPGLHSCLSQGSLDAAKVPAVVLQAIRHHAASTRSGTHKRTRTPDDDGDVVVDDDESGGVQHAAGVRRLSAASLLFGLKTVYKLKPSADAVGASGAGAAKRMTTDQVRELCADKYEEALCSSVVQAADIGVSWADIGGLAETKEVLKEVLVYPLRFPQLYAEGLAAQAPKGVLFFGPPGTGKTMLAKAVASECRCNFLCVDSTTIGSKWYGESEKYAKAVFSLARKLSPCVIFIDEVDSLLSSRDDSERATIASVKTTLMQMWDGLQSAGANDRVMVVAATNRPFALDEAILRRMPRRVLVDLPGVEEREAILRVCLSKNRVSDDVDLQALAAQLDNYSGSDIRELCREAAVRVSHEYARTLADQAEAGKGPWASATAMDTSAPQLRPLAKRDFEMAKERVRASVAADSPVSEKVRQWNEKYGETGSQHMRKPWASMYS